MRMITDFIKETHFLHGVSIAACYADVLSYSYGKRRPSVTSCCHIKPTQARIRKSILSAPPKTQFQDMC